MFHLWVSLKSEDIMKVKNVLIHSCINMNWNLLTKKLTVIGSQITQVILVSYWLLVLVDFSKQKKRNVKIILKNQNFSEKREIANKITLLDSKKIKLNNFFQNTTKSLNIIENSHILDYRSSTTSPTDKAINTYKNHPSILLIKQKFPWVKWKKK